jgi:hypothetical protein
MTVTAELPTCTASELRYAAETLLEVGFECRAAHRAYYAEDHPYRATWLRDRADAIARVHRYAERAARMVDGDPERVLAALNNVVSRFRDNEVTPYRRALLVKLLTA